jgi:hypothetical protein
LQLAELLKARLSAIGKIEHEDDAALANEVTHIHDLIGIVDESEIRSRLSDHGGRRAGSD